MQPISQLGWFNRSFHQILSTDTISGHQHEFLLAHKQKHSEDDNDASNAVDATVDNVATDKVDDDDNNLKPMTLKTQQPHPTNLTTMATTSTALTTLHRYSLRLTYRIISFSSAYSNSWYGFSIIPPPSILRSTF